MRKIMCGCSMQDEMSEFDVDKVEMITGLKQQVNFMFQKGIEFFKK